MFESQHSIVSVARVAGLGSFRGRDPRVTLAALAHPGLLSVVASRLVVASFHIECMLTLPSHFPLAQPNTSLDASADRAAQTAPWATDISLASPTC
jgi:hypothetical protein